MTGPAVQVRTPGVPAPASPAVPSGVVPPSSDGTAPTPDLLIPWFVCAHAHIEPRDYLAERNRCSDCGLVLIR